MAASLENHFLNEAEWRELLFQFPAEIIAWQLLTAQVPYVFRQEPFRYATLRKMIGQAFGVEPTSVFIVGSALTGKSLEPGDFGQPHSATRGMEIILVSEGVFTTWLSKSMHWLAEMTADRNTGAHTTLSPEQTSQVFAFSSHAMGGVWLPETLPSDCWIRSEFSSQLSRFSVELAGLLTSVDGIPTLRAKLARSADSAVQYLASSLLRLRMHFSATLERGAGQAKEKAAAKGTSVPRQFAPRIEPPVLDHGILDLIGPASRPKRL